MCYGLRGGAAIAYRPFTCLLLQLPTAATASVLVEDLYIISGNFVHLRFAEHFTIVDGLKVCLTLCLFMSLHCNAGGTCCVVVHNCFRHRLMPRILCTFQMQIIALSNASVAVYPQRLVTIPKRSALKEQTRNTVNTHGYRDQTDVHGDSSMRASHQQGSSR